MTARAPPITVRRMETIHATCVAYDGRGVLLRGASGAGKSDLALRAIADGARLVADDRVLLTRNGDCVVASAPQPLRGLIEIRGLGILRMAAEESASVALVADLEPPSAIARLPERGFCDLLGAAVARVALAPFEASAPLKLRHALDAAIDPERLVTERLVR